LALTISAAPIDAAGLGTGVTGTILYASLYGPISGVLFTAASILDTAGMTAWDVRVRSSGFRVSHWPMGVSWALTGVTLAMSIAAWALLFTPTSDYDTMDAMVVGTAVTSGLAMGTEIANLFVRHLWWRRSLTRAVHADRQGREPMSASHVP
jgi:hypothetical protein